MTIQIEGADSMFSHFLKIDLNHKTIFIINKIVDITKKNIDKNNAIQEVNLTCVIAAGAASPTQIIANAIVAIN